MLKILQIGDRESQGGAAKAAFRLHEGLRRSGHESSLLVFKADIRDPDTRTVAEATAEQTSDWDRFLDRVKIRAARRIGARKGLDGRTGRIMETDAFREADIIHLHHLHSGEFNLGFLPELTLQKPVVWTLHDMGAFTGHCAYSYDCVRWETGCFECPLFIGEKRLFAEPPPTKFDRTGPIWRRKRDLYRRSRLHIVTPSEWLQGLAERSILGAGGSIKCIPYGLDLDVFRPVDREAAKRALDIPPGARTILFIAEDVSKKRKGLDHLMDALSGLQDLDDLVLITVGSRQGLGEKLHGFETRELGTVESEILMRQAYNAGDVFVFPTLADNLPIVLLESLACGTPIVAFDVGGVPEIVQTGETGALVAVGDVGGLAEGVRRLFGDPDELAAMRKRCRAVAEARYSLANQAARYVELYEGLLA